MSYYRHCAVYPLCIHSSSDTSWHYPHSLGEQMEAQRGQATFPRPQSWQVTTGSSRAVGLWGRTFSRLTFLVSLRKVGGANGSVSLFSLTHLASLLEGRRRLPHQELQTLTRFKIRGASLAVVTVGAALAHAQTFGPRESGAAVVRTRSALARVKLGCVFLESSPEVVPSGHRTGDVSYQVRDGSELERRSGHGHVPLPRFPSPPSSQGMDNPTRQRGSCRIWELCQLHRGERDEFFPFLSHSSSQQDSLASVVPEVWPVRCAWSLGSLDILLWRCPLPGLASCYVLSGKCMHQNTERGEQGLGRAGMSC